MRALRRAAVVRRRAVGGAGGPAGVRATGAAGVAQAAVALPGSGLWGGHGHCGGCSTPGTPTARSATPGAAEETLCSVYDIGDAEAGAATVAQLACDLQDPGLPPEVNRLGRTIWRWRHQISNWHAARVTNAATDAANNLIKRVKRAAFGY